MTPVLERFLGLLLYGAYFLAALAILCAVAETVKVISTWYKQRVRHTPPSP